MKRTGDRRRQRPIDLRQGASDNDDRDHVGKTLERLRQLLEQGILKHIQNDDGPEDVRHGRGYEKCHHVDFQEADADPEG